MMKSLLIVIAFVLLQQCTAKVRLAVKGEKESTKEICTPILPFTCEKNCPPGCRKVLDICHQCSCVAIDLPVCQKECRNGVMFPPCNCVPILWYAYSSRAAVCNLPVKTGMCRGYFPRYYYDSRSGECKSFIYGGCQGNANNFHSKQACESACH